jgi:3-oxoacyl-[acyl-carrier protein] reductase
MGKNILITGAGRGIGFAVAESLEDMAEELVLVTKSESFERMDARFRGAATYKVDLTCEEELKRFVREVRSLLDRLDVLINNAGAYVGKKFDETGAGELDELYRLHVRAPFTLIKGFLPLLKKSEHPQIINISSAANFARLPGESAYTATKAALSALGDVLREELKKYKIRVTNIHPWAVNTKDFESPGDFLRPEDIGDLVSFVVKAHPNCQVMNVEVSSASDWRGNWPPWIPE